MLGGLDMREYRLTKIKNSRYRQLQIGNDYYLLDLDAKKWLWFFPLCVWLFPIKAYRLEKPKEVRERRKAQLDMPLLLAPILTITLSTFLSRRLFVEQHFSNLGAILIILVLSQFSLFLGKCWMSQKAKIDTVTEAQDIKLYYDIFDVKQFRVRLACMGAIFLLTIFFAREFVLKGNIIALICSTAITGFLYGLTNWSEPPGKITSVEQL